MNGCVALRVTSPLTRKCHRGLHERPRQGLGALLEGLKSNRGLRTLDMGYKSIASGQSLCTLLGEHTTLTVGARQKQDVHSSATWRHGSRASHFMHQVRSAPLSRRSSEDNYRSIRLQYGRIRRTVALVTLACGELRDEASACQGVLPPSECFFGVEVARGAVSVAQTI